jgi:hypothetical protein
MSGKLLLLCLLLAGAQLVRAQAPAATPGAQPLQKLWSERKFDGIDLLLRRHCLADTRQANGDSALAAFETAFDQQFRSSHHWARERAALTRWQQLVPNSLAAALVEAIYWRAYAGQVRPDTDADKPRAAAQVEAQVEAQVRAQVKAHLARASARLQQVKAQGSTCPLWFSLNISMLLESGVAREAAARAYMDAVLAFPQAPLIHLAMAPAYSPRNGGSAVQFDQFARRAVYFTHQEEGAGMYARLYWKEDGKGEKAIQFQDPGSLPEWRLVKGGFEDLLQRYPHDLRNRNKYASFACRANDRATYARLRRELGEHIEAALWPDGWTVQECDRKLGKNGLTG